MKERPPLPAPPYLVVGLARSGAAVARVLEQHGEVAGCDSGRPPEAAELPASRFHLQSDGIDLLDGVRTVVKSPGVPSEAPVIAAARDRGIEVVGELEIAWRLLPDSEFVAVTGTNGKTTTAELLGAIFREAGEDVAVAGNVGTPLSALIPSADALAEELVAEGKLSRGDADSHPQRSVIASGPALVVCEASSFQLEDSSAFAPECALLLNLSEDHLDRHGTFEAYRDAKLRVFQNQGPGDIAVVPAGFGEVPGEAQRVTFGHADADLARREGRLLWRDEPVMDVAGIRLRGEHNVENAMGAAAVALARGTSRDAVVAALSSFAGVPHRLEEVAERDGVLYVNDSKATNVESARVGIEAFSGGVHAILGGSLKGGGFEALRQAVSSRCVAVYLIGEAAERLAADLEGTVPLHSCGDLVGAVAAASRSARPGEVVLLSPACASYDQYAHYEERGEHFRSLVGG